MLRSTPSTVRELDDSMDLDAFSETQSLTDSGSLAQSEGYESVSQSGSYDSALESGSESSSYDSALESGSESGSYDSASESGAESESYDSALESDDEEADIRDMVRYAANQRFLRAEASFEAKAYVEARQYCIDAIEILMNVGEGKHTSVDFRKFDEIYNNLGVACHRLKLVQEEVAAYFHAYSSLHHAMALEEMPTSDLDRKWLGVYSYYIASGCEKLNNPAAHDHYTKTALTWLTQLSPSLHDKETQLIVANLYLDQGYYKSAVEWLQSIEDRSDDAYFRLLAECENALGVVIDSGEETASEYTVIAARYLGDAIDALRQVKSPTRQDEEDLELYKENYETSMDMVQDAMASVGQTVVSSSMFSLFAVSQTVRSVPAQQDQSFEQVLAQAMQFRG